MAVDGFNPSELIPPEYLYPDVLIELVDKNRGQYPGELLYCTTVDVIGTLPEVRYSVVYPLLTPDAVRPFCMNRTFAVSKKYS
jgi:hypothetical protein